MADVVHFGPIDPASVTSDIRDTEGNVVHKGNAPEGQQCWFNGQPFSENARSCQEGKIMVCNQWGTWDQTFESC